MSKYQKIRDVGILPPSEIERMKKSDNSTKSLRDKGVLSPSQVKGKSYKYFPDNP